MDEVPFSLSLSQDVFLSLPGDKKIKTRIVCAKIRYRKKSMRRGKRYSPPRNFIVVQFLLCHVLRKKNSCEGMLLFALFIRSSHFTLCTRYLGQYLSRARVLIFGTLIGSEEKSSCLSFEKKKLDCM